MAATTTSVSPVPAQRWLFGPAPDLLLETMPDNPLALRLAGLVFQQTGQPERARELLARARSYEGHEYEAHGTREAREDRVEATSSATSDGPRKPVVY